MSGITCAHVKNHMRVKVLLDLTRETFVYSLWETSQLAYGWSLENLHYIGVYFKRETSAKRTRQVLSNEVDKGTLNVVKKKLMFQVLTILDYCIYIVKWVYNFFFIPQYHSNIIWCVYDKDHMGALQLKNTRGCDLHSYVVTSVVTNKAQKKFSNGMPFQVTT